MPFVNRWREQLYEVSGYLVEAFDGLVAEFRLFENEHKPDGTHADIVADSVTIQGNKIPTQTIYTPTLADVENTTTETTFLKFFVPADKMLDGDEIRISLIAKAKNNKGTTGNSTTRLSWGGTQGTVVALGHSNDAGEGVLAWEYVILRTGIDLYASLVSPTAGDAVDTFLFVQSGLVASPGFATRVPVELSMELDAADANFYFKPQVAKIVHISGLGS